MYDETKIYINTDVVKDNDVFNKQATAFAEGVRTSSKDQQIDILNRIGVPLEDQEKYLNDPASQADIITEALINDNIKRLTGSPDVKKDGDEFYITEYSKDRAKPKPEATETKAAKSSEQIKTRAKKRVEAVLKNPLTAIRAVQNIGPSQAIQEGKIVKLYPDSEDEMVFDMNRKEDVAKLAKKLEEAEFGSDANTDQSFIEIDNFIESRQEKRKLP
mgnify:FL=1